MHVRSVFRRYLVTTHHSDRPRALTPSQVVKSGGKVVFSQAGSYIDLGDGRRDQIEFKNGLYVLKLWVPRDQKMDFHGQA